MIYAGLQPFRYNHSFSTTGKISNKANNESASNNFQKTNEKSDKKFFMNIYDKINGL